MREGVGGGGGGGGNAHDRGITAGKMLREGRSRRHDDRQAQKSEQKRSSEAMHGAAGQVVDCFGQGRGGGSVSATAKPADTGPEEMPHPTRALRFSALFQSIACNFKSEISATHQ